MRKLVLAVVLALAAIALPFASASALPFVNGSIPINPLVVSVSSGSNDVSGADGFLLTFTLTGAGTGDLGPFAVGTSVAVTNPYTFVPSTPILAFLTFTSGPLTAVFDLASSSVTDRNLTTSGGTVDVFSLGTLHLTGYADTLASLNFAATQSGASWSASATFVATGRSTQSVPEPITLAVFGAGLAGLGVIRRKKAD